MSLEHSASREDGGRGLSTEDDVELGSIHTLCRIFECHPATIWRRVNDGTLPRPLKIGGLTRWRMAAIRDRIRQAEEAA